MNLKIILRIVEWFKKYQKGLKKAEAIKLYEKLIEEEGNETLAAFKEGDLRSYLDWIADLYWVGTIYFYLTDSVNYDFYAVCYKFLSETNVKQRKWKDLLDDLLKEVVRSNFTKELNLQTEGEKVGKVIKWEKFVAPDIDKIIKKYNIKWKD